MIARLRMFNVALPELVMVTYCVLLREKKKTIPKSIDVVESVTAGLGTGVGVGVEEIGVDVGGGVDPGVGLAPGLGSPLEPKSAPPLLVDASVTLEDTLAGAQF
jgi:hypothetical protein